MNVKFKSILNRNEVDDQTQYVRFYRKNQGESTNINPEVVLARPTWESMGHPTHLTITIESGNVLNDE